MRDEGERRNEGEGWMEERKRWKKERGNEGRKVWWEGREET